MPRPSGAISGSDLPEVVAGECQPLLAWGCNPESGKQILAKGTADTRERPHTSHTCLALCMYIKSSRASLVVQWLRIPLPTQGTRVRALVREDPTCRRATKPVRHNS